MLAQNGQYTNYCGKYHCGLDFLAPEGTPVYAGVTGTVKQINCPDPKVCKTTDDNFGPYSIHIQVGEYIIIYGHLDGNFQMGLNDEVNPDTIIAGVGEDGSGISHLHVEITDWEYTYNPLPFFGPDLRAALVNLAFEFRGAEPPKNLSEGCA